MTKWSKQLPPSDDELWSLVEAVVEGSAAAPEVERLESPLARGRRCSKAFSTWPISTCMPICN